MGTRRRHHTHRFESLLSHFAARDERNQHSGRRAAQGSVPALALNLAAQGVCDASTRDAEVELRGG